MVNKNLSPKNIWYMKIAQEFSSAQFSSVCCLAHLWVHVISISESRCDGIGPR